MSTRITLTGTGGRISADRQELQAYLRGPAPLPGYDEGWNVKYTTELTPGVRFYLRGEEYSAQIDDFVDAVRERAAAQPRTASPRRRRPTAPSALMLADAAPASGAAAPASRPAPRRAWFGLGAAR